MRNEPKNQQADLWLGILEELSTVLSPYNYKNWVKPLNFIGFDGKVLTIEAPGKFFHDWIVDKYLNDITIACKTKLSDDIKVDLICGTEIPHSRNGSDNKRTSFDKVLRERNLNPRYTFDSFVPGPGNEFAYAACRRVSTAPGTTSYNPLFIFGGVGLGKTHLLHSIGIEILSHSENSTITYITSERFTNELINAIRFERMEDFRGKYRAHHKAILIDDIQFLAGKERTQEEFFHTFNSLHETNCQIILTGDRYPQDIDGLEERLQSRFNWGLVADIKPPDTETKAAILAKKAAVENFELPEDVALFIASNIDGNVRDLEGALIRLEAYCSLTKTEVSIDAARECLKNIIRQKKEIITIDAIQKAVASFYSIRFEDLKSSSRVQHLAFARQVSIYLCRQLTKASTTAIGEKFGGRDHTTVIYAVRKIENLLKEDSEFRSRYDSLYKKICN